MASEGDRPAECGQHTQPATERGGTLPSAARPEVLRLSDIYNAAPSRAPQSYPSGYSGTNETAEAPGTPLVTTSRPRLQKPQPAANNGARAASSSLKRPRYDQQDGLLWGLPMPAAHSEVLDQIYTADCGQTAPSRLAAAQPPDPVAQQELLLPLLQPACSQRWPPETVDRRQQAHQASVHDSLCQEGTEQGLPEPPSVSAFQAPAKLLTLAEATDRVEALPSVFDHERFKQLVTMNLLRGVTGSQTGGEGNRVTLKALEAEQKRLEVSKQQVLHRIYELSQVYVLQEAAEARVLELIEGLQKLRAWHPGPGDRRRKTKDLLDFVDHINVARGACAPGVQLRVSKALAQKISSFAWIPEFQEIFRLYLCKLDVTGTTSCFREMLLFLGGNTASGEVVMELSFGNMKGQRFKLKDLAALKIESMAEWFNHYRLVNKDELWVQLEIADSPEARARAAEAVAHANIEFIVAAYLFSLHRQAQDFFTRSTSTSWPVEEEAQPGPSDTETAKIVNQTVERAIGLTDMQLALLWAVQESKASYDKAITAKLALLREQVSKLVETLPEHSSRANSAYLAVLESVNSLHSLLLDAQLLEPLGTFTSSTILTPLQAAHALIPAHPHVPNLTFMYTAGILSHPNPEQLRRVKPAAQRIIRQIVGNAGLSNLDQSAD